MEQAARIVIARRFVTRFRDEIVSGFDHRPQRALHAATYRLVVVRLDRAVQELDELGQEGPVGFRLHLLVPPPDLTQSRGETRKNQSLP
jgi:hypothetical protein